MAGAAYHWSFGTTAGWIMAAAYWLVPALAAAAFTYYNIPLLETGRPTIGANHSAAPAISTHAHLFQLNLAWSGVGEPSPCSALG